MKNKGFILKISVVILLALSMVVFAACGSDSKYDSYGNEYIEKGEVAEGTANDNIGNGSESINAQQNVKIIRNVSIDGETKDFDSANETVKAKVSEFGGYIEKSNIYGGESLSSKYRSAKNATFVIRIPAENLDSFLEQAEGLLNVTSSSETTTDVTLEYYDIQSRLDTLKSKKAALEAMLEKAETLDEIITIQNNLYEVIADIEAYQSQLNVYDNKVSYSTVNLKIIEVLEYTVVEEEEPEFGTRIKEGFVNSWVTFGEFCQDLAVLIASTTPLLICPLTVAIIVAIVVAIVKSNKKKKAEKAKEKAE